MNILVFPCRYNFFIYVPYQLERLITFGTLLCLDSFLVSQQQRVICVMMTLSSNNESSDVHVCTVRNSLNVHAEGLNLAKQHHRNCSQMFVAEGSKHATDISTSALLER